MNNHYAQKDIMKGGYCMLPLYEYCLSCGKSLGRIGTIKNCKKCNNDYRYGIKNTICKYEGCTNRVEKTSYGLCKEHYFQVKKDNEIATFSYYKRLGGR